PTRRSSDLLTRRTQPRLQNLNSELFAPHRSALPRQRAGKVTERGRLLSSHLSRNVIAAQGMNLFSGLIRSTDFIGSLRLIDQQRHCRFCFLLSCALVCESSA